MQVLLENGLVRASLEARESNLPAVRHYQSLGYEIVNREIQMIRFI
jgi:ribosomal protein S18 acetylase RimI-like enzyme